MLPSPNPLSYRDAGLKRTPILPNQINERFRDPLKDQGHSQLNDSLFASKNFLNYWVTMEIKNEET